MKKTKKLSEDPCYGLLIPAWIYKAADNLGEDSPEFKKTLRRFLFSKYKGQA